MPSNFRAYLELLRLPAVFTAVADVLMGIIVAGWSSKLEFGDMHWMFDVIPLLIAASSCLYLSGMVLNDYFDRQTDAAERPERPIPSGRVSPKSAAWLGGGLLLAGVALTGAAAFYYGNWLPALLGLGLAACIVLYDAVLKRTSLGPLAMGACRTLNVLLGMSISLGPWQTPHYLIAGGLGLFIAGVTWISRNEVGGGHRLGLLGGAALMWLGMAAVAWFPRAGRLTLLADSLEMWFVFWLLLALQIGFRVLQAVMEPSEGRVQAVVKHGILSLVVFDATIVFAVAGTEPALVVLSLLVPMLLLGRWLYVT